MKVLFVASFLSAFLLPPSVTTPTESFQLEIEISGVERANTPKVWVSIFAGKEKFLKKPITTKTAVLREGKAIVTFDLPPGEYAVSTYYDLNSNNKLDRHFYGKPKEPIGFSNNIRPSIGPPKYDKCSFLMTSSPKKISINLID